ncbi:NXF1 factor, partial [Amia calva]|nr:NXF1 factor [Amia calva]
LCILRDDLYVWNATSEEIKRAFVTTRLRPSSTPVPTLTAAQQEMRSIFCLKFGMNPEWSQKCVVLKLTADHCSTLMCTLVC